MSTIGWTNKTWNPTVGCSKVSDGCKNCYAMHQAGRVDGFQHGRSVYHDVIRKRAGHGFEWNGEVRLLPARLTKPLHWKKARRIFVDSMSDLFHESIPFEFTAAVFGIIALARRHTFQILTKRPERMREFFAWLADEHGVEPADGEWATPRVLIESARHFIGKTGDAKALRKLEDRIAIRTFCRWPLSNAWLGVSVEDGPSMARLQALQETPAAIRFASFEPARDYVNWSAYVDADAECWCGDAECDHATIDWIIIGGETGAKARPTDLDVVRHAVAQCRFFSIPVFVKQLGARPIGVNVSGKGEKPAEWPADLARDDFQAYPDRTSPARNAAS